MRGGGVVLGRDEELPGSMELAGAPASLQLALSHEVDVAAIAGPVAGGQLPQLSSGAEIIGLELISALDVTECLRLLAAGPGLMRGDEVNG